MKRFSLDLYSVLTNAKVPELFGKKSLLMCTAEANTSENSFSSTNNNRAEVLRNAVSSNYDYNNFVILSSLI